MNLLRIRKPLQHRATNLRRYQQPEIRILGLAADQNELRMQHVRGYNVPEGNKDWKGTRR